MFLLCENLNYYSKRRYVRFVSFPSYLRKIKVLYLLASTNDFNFFKGSLNFFSTFISGSACSLAFDDDFLFDIWIRSNFFYAFKKFIFRHKKGIWR